MSNESVAATLVVLFIVIISLTVLVPSCVEQSAHDNIEHLNKDFNNLPAEIKTVEEIK